jgi:two-component system, NtrC family, response regulator AtoC
MAEAMRNGANLFLTKPVAHEELCQAVDLLIPSMPVISISSRPAPSAGKAELDLRTGNWSRKIEPLLKRLSSYDVPILLQGETGVGKEVLARHIHDRSLRSEATFLKLNCAALPPELVESELFGYEKGAFTGAFRSNPGKFELADGGTILLDEIGDMDLRLQAKLLQVLQDREFYRIGAKDPTRVNVRVIAATHRDLEARIEEGQFREDLYYRLNVVNFLIPALRERLDEIIPLASFFLRKHAGDTSIPEITPELRTALYRHLWPGNIRELENVMRRYLVVRNADLIVEELNRATNRAVQSTRLAKAMGETSLSAVAAAAGAASYSAPAAHRAASTATPMPSPIPPPSDEENSEFARLDRARKSAESEVIMKALYSTQWNRKRAASLLGIDYKALLYKMKKLNID